MSSQRKKYNYKAVVLAVVISEVLFWIAAVGLYFVLLNYVPTIRFHNPKAAWGLLMIPAISIFHLLVVRKKNNSLNKFAQSDLVPFVVPHISTTRTVFKFFFFRMGIVLIILGIVDPKVGSKMAEVKTRGIDIMICMDVSTSMEAQDVAPSRLEGAKRAVYQLIERLEGDRIGIVVFAGNAFVQLPITSDHEAAKLFLETINTNIINTQGTAIGQAIELAMESFDKEQGARKIIVVITDGENHEDDAVGAAELAASENMVVHAIGMGSVEGAPIPLFNRYGKQIGYKEDGGGNTVVTALDETTLREIVEAGGGVMVRASGNYIGLNELVSKIQSEEKEELASFEFEEFEHRFQWFIGLGLLLLILDYSMAERRKKWSEKLNLFDL